MRGRAALTLLALATAPAAAQVSDGPDATTVTRYRALLMGLRDTVDRVSSQGNEFRRDLQGVGETTVLARAARLEAACRDARTALTEARPELRSAKLSLLQAGARDSLLTAIGALTASLERDCERGLGPKGPGSRADTVRAWGPNRTASLAQAINGFHSAAARLARRLGVDLIKR